MTRYKYRVECQDMDWSEWAPTTFDDLTAASRFAEAQDNAMRIGTAFKNMTPHAHRVVWVKQPEAELNVPESEDDWDEDDYDEWAERQVSDGP